MGFSYHNCVSVGRFLIYGTELGASCFKELPPARPCASARILRCCRSWIRNDVEGIARFVTLDEIGPNDHTPNIPRYVKPKVNKQAFTVNDAVKRLRVSAEAVFAGEEKLILILRKEGLLTK